MAGFVTKLYRNFILDPLGIDTQNAIVFWLTICLGSTTLFGLWLFEGDVLLTVLTVLWIGIFFLSVFRIDYSLLLLIAAALFFDQFPIPNTDYSVYQTAFFSNINEISFIPGLTYGFVSPLDLQLIVIAFVLFLWMTTKRDFNWQSVPVFVPYLMFLLAVLGAIMYGIHRGADILSAINDSRALIYFLFFFLLVSQIIRKKRHIRIFIWILIAAVSAKAIEFIYRFFTATDTGVDLSTLLGPELPFFLLVILCFLLSYWTMKVDDVQKVCLLFLLPLFLFALLLGATLYTYTALLVALMIFALLLPAVPLWRFLALVVPCIFGVFIYTSVYWDYHEIFTRPEGAFQALEIPLEERYRNVQGSNENESIVNSADIFTTNVLFGDGFGPSSIAAADEPQAETELQNDGPGFSLTEIITKIGAIGFFALWFFFSAYIAKAVKVFKELQDPYLKAIVVAIITSCVVLLSLSLFEDQLSFFRSMIFLGSLMGILAAISQISSAELDKDTRDILEKDEQTQS